jgi:hypothetical protein
MAMFDPGYGLPASLDSFYTNTSSTGMMATFSLYVSKTGSP